MAGPPTSTTKGTRFLTLSEEQLWPSFTSLGPLTTQMNREHGFGDITSIATFALWRLYGMGNGMQVKFSFLACG